MSVTLYRIPAVANGQEAPRFRANHRNVATKVVDLLMQHSIVILTGKKRPFVLNRNIGKTVSCKAIRTMLSNKRRKICYLDIKQLLNLEAGRGSIIRLDKFLDNAVDNLPECDVYIFDEIHQAFPRASVHRRDATGKPIYRGEEYNETMVRFWKKITNLRSKGKKFLMVTAQHPHDKAYQQFLSTQDIDPFFCAPIVELSFDFHPLGK